jgi:acetyl-CoA acetyltransferase
MTAPPATRGAAAIAGVGYTPLTKNSGVSPLELALGAIRAAVADAGLTLFDIDGLATHHLNDSAAPSAVRVALGLQDVTWVHEEFGGGSKAPLTVGAAALAVHAGLARHVVVYRAMNGRSGVRMGGSSGPSPALDQQYESPYGLLAPAHSYGLGARMHMNRFGTTAAQLGTIAVQQRAFAADNPRALMRSPMTLDDYFASRPIADPFRLFDCCLETDGACALVVTTAERAADLRPPPVAIAGFAATIGPDGWSDGRTPLTTTAAANLAPRLWAMAGVGPEDVDVAEIYDAFTFAVLVQLEDYGFCAKGEGGPMIESGVTARGGALPVNTHGGFLSEGYIHGINHIAEGVSQLRGDAGPRQVPDAEVALCTAQPGYLTGSTSALVLTR